jgi:tRNA A58 N-methylase Trm61
MDVFPILLKEKTPKRIIEVGTGFGGLTLFLRDILPSTTDIYSFDILKTDYHNALIESNINVRHENIFNDKVKDWNCYELNEKWVNLFDISPKIVICDGGNKKAEFNCIASSLKQGDVIMLHDYSTDKESFERLNVWNWLESQYSEIQPFCEKYNLQPFMHEEFLKVAWGCFIKV